MSFNDDDDDDDDDDDNDYYYYYFDNAKNCLSTNFVELEAVKREKIIFWEDLNRLFPKAKEIFKEEEKIKNKIPLLNYNNIMKELIRGQIPPELDFFVGGDKNMDLKNQINQLGVDEDSPEFLSYLQLEYCGKLIKRNKIKIHLESVNLFFDNKDSGESIYNFFSPN